MSKNGSNLYSTFKVSNSYMDQSAYVDTVESHITVLTYMYIYIYIYMCVCICVYTWFSVRIMARVYNK